MTEESIHRTVLLNETIQGLNLLGEDQIVLDGTFGGGGHSEKICSSYPGIKVIALDQDKGAWDRAKSKFKHLKCDISFVNENFRNIGRVVRPEELDGVIFDLGLSSDQLDNSGRGFTFRKEEPLLMTMKEHPKEEDLTAEEIVNTWSEENLATIIYGYGEERFSRRIAKGIVDARAKKPIKTTTDLVSIIEKSVPAPYRRGRIHFATKTFQALRIAVNDELGALTDGLKEGWKALKPGGRMAVISFHSLEDRVVKRFFKAIVENKEGTLANKKPIIASDEEVKENPRSRSAKLRIIEKNKTN